MNRDKPLQTENRGGERIGFGEGTPASDHPYANTLITLQRLHSLAFGFGTFVYTKGQASLPLDGLLKGQPASVVKEIRWSIHGAGFASATEANPAWVDDVATREESSFLQEHWERTGTRQKKGYVINRRLLFEDTYCF